MAFLPLALLITHISVSLFLLSFLFVLLSPSFLHISVNQLCFLCFATLFLHFFPPSHLPIMKAFIAAGLASAFAALASAVPSFTVGTIHHKAAPILSSVHAEVVPDSYLVKFKDHVTDDHALEHHSWIQQIHDSNERERVELRKRGQIPILDAVFTGLKHTYKIGDNFLGYSGHFDESVIESIRNHPDVR